MDELTHIIAKYTPEPEMLLLLIFLFALGKSVIFVSSVLPPASVTLLMGIVGASALPVSAVWAAITLGAALGSILSFHCGALLCRRDLGSRLPARFHAPLHKAQRAPAKARVAIAVRLAFSGGNALYRTAGGRHAEAAAGARLCHRRTRPPPGR